MIHHLLRHGVKHAAKFYATNPNAAVQHGSAGVQIGKMVWTHGPKVAKHTAKFMVKAASRGFSLFRS